jgi:Ribulose-5-phosphate 4-epimerase and related epimerases and aldolases
MPRGMTRSASCTRIRSRASPLPARSGACCRSINGRCSSPAASPITTTKVSRSISDERERLVADLGDKFVMVLRNHGMLTCGRSVAEAFKLMHNLERSCRAQLPCSRPAPRSSSCPRRSPARRPANTPASTTRSKPMACPTANGPPSSGCLNDRSRFCELTNTTLTPVARRSAFFERGK